MPICNCMLHLRKKFFKKFAKDKNYQKVGEHCNFIGKYTGAAHSMCDFRFNVLTFLYLIYFSQWVKLWSSFYHKGIN